MLCCPDNPSYAPVNTDERTANANCSYQPRDWNQYPGRALSPSNQTPPPDSVLIKTGGNALTAVDANAASSSGMVAVSVPDGVEPGQNILVSTPDDSGRLISVIVPDGALPGHTFLVRAPTVVAPPVVETGIPVNPNAAHAATLEMTNLESKPANQLLAVQGKDVASGDERDLLLTPEPTTKVDEPPGGPSPGQNLVLVQVPPGTAAGSKIKVKLPGNDNRTVEAVAPGNVSQFYVDVPPANDSEIMPNNRNVLLVQVPSGAAPGSKIHVQLPGNDSRTVEAVVPEGNVSQFYVEVPPQPGSESNSSNRNEENSNGQNLHDNSLASGGPTTLPPVV